MRILQLADPSGNTSAKINLKNSQMFSLTHNELELMWGGGRPDEDKTAAEKAGWQNSEILMFPIVGPAKDGSILVGGKRYPMAQHGLARHAGFSLLESCRSVARFVQAYRACTEVGAPNAACVFPFDYSITKSYTVGEGSLTLVVEVRNESAEPMPYALGWHPAFLTFPDGTGEHYVRILPASKIPLEQIKSRSGGRSIVERASKAEYVCPSGTIALSSPLGLLQLWSPEGQNQVCIEPISAPPDPGYAGELGQRPGYGILSAGSVERFEFRVEFLQANP